MNNSSIVKRFIYLSIVFGMILLVLTPPFQAPDEDSHFKKAYVISKGNLFPEVQNGKIGFMLPEGLVNYIEEQTKKAGDLDETFEYKEIYLSERLPGEYGAEKFYNFSTATTNPLAHIIPASGIIFGEFIAKIIQIGLPSIVYYLYFARMFNLLFYIIIIAISIHISPILKRTIAMVGLMPMALFLASTASYDTLLIALAFLATAIIFSLSYGETQKKLTMPYIVILGIIAYLFIAIKIVYLPLFLLMLFLPKRELSNIKEYVKKLLILFAIVIGIYLVFRFITPSLEAVDPKNTDILVSKQIDYVIHHPVQYCKIFFNTLKETRLYLVSSTIGVFGLLDTNLFCAFLGLYLICMPILGIFEISIDKVKVKIIDRMVVLISVMASVFGCYLAMYIYWTISIDGYGVGAQSITGVQGRYFIPMMPVSFLIFANLRLQKNEKLRKIMIGIVDNYALLSIVMLSVSCIVILLRFWC